MRCDFSPGMLQQLSGECRLPDQAWMGLCCSQQNSLPTQGVAVGSRPHTKGKEVAIAGMGYEMKSL